MNSRDRFLAACRCEPVDRTPIWFMRQAGRYLPEYRALKERHTFLELAKTPELAATVTLQPLLRFDLDAAIVFSDILVIPEALGQPYGFSDAGGIAMEYKIDSPHLIEQLDPNSIAEKLSYVASALTIVGKELRGEKALIGFGGSPWTLATYMVEGGHSKEFSLIKNLYYNEPTQFRELLEKITVALIDYFRMQIAAGVDALQIFDSWGSACPDADYKEMSLCWIRRIVDALPERFPVILFAKGMAHHASALIGTGTKVLSMDWTVKLSDIRKGLPSNVALQGNLDPEFLNTNPERVVSETSKILEDVRPYNGHIFNLGHGIQPSAKIENVQAMIDTVVGFH